MNQFVLIGTVASAEQVAEFRIKIEVRTEDDQVFPIECVGVMADAGKLHTGAAVALKGRFVMEAGVIRLICEKMALTETGGRNHA